MLGELCKKFKRVDWYDKFILQNIEDFYFIIELEFIIDEYYFIIELDNIILLYNYICIFYY